MADQAEWVLVSLDDKASRKHGMPPQVPVPKADFESLADKGLDAARVRQWIAQFLQGAPSSWRTANASLASRYDAFLGKTPHWEKAQKAFADRDYGAATKALEFVTRIDPNDYAAKLNIAMCYANTAEHAKALLQFEAIRETFEGDADYHIAVGHVQMALENRDEAIHEMASALEANPEATAALRTLVELGVLVSVYEDPRVAASHVYVRADSVLTYLQEQWDQAPRDLNFFLDQVSYHELEHRYDVVRAGAERAIAIGGDAKGIERAEVARIAALRALGNLSGALAEAEAYTVKTPDAVGGWVELGQTLLALGKKPEGHRAIERALELDPSNLQALSLAFLPDERDDLLKLKDALPALQAFAANHPDAPGVWRSIARAKLILGDDEAALGLFQKALSLDTNDDALRTEYWAELGKLKRYDEVLRDAATIDDIAKRDWKLRWGEAEAFVGAGKKLEARTAFSSINLDESLHLDVRKRAKRAAQSIQGE